jgi:hypothetical protein
MKARYTIESVGRALTHHLQTGAVTHLRIPEGGAADTKWTVEVAGLSDRESLTLHEAYALCLGLAAGQRVYGGAVHAVLAEHAADPDAPLSMNMVQELRKAAAV